MNQEETIALFMRCEAARAEARAAGKDEDAAHEAAKDVWNGWAAARNVERQALEKAGEWKTIKDWRGVLEPQNDATREWLEAATVDFSHLLFDAALAQKDKTQVGELVETNDTEDVSVKTISIESVAIRFDEFVFPGNTRFEGATFTHYARFKGTTFTGDAEFGKATFTHGAWFKGVTFKGNAWFKVATFTHDAWFEKATFTHDARFEKATFTGYTHFDEATFTGNTWFERTKFTGYAQFNAATFTGDAFCSGATFTGDTQFDEATFTGNTWFDEATFTGGAQFYAATFTGSVWFRRATFPHNTQFERATFTGIAQFDAATFTGDANFKKAKFTGNTWFERTKFTGCAQFEEATFTGDAFCSGATFTGDAQFERATFTGNAQFKAATFTGDAQFEKATFTGNAQFEKATFTGDAGFEKVRFFADAFFPSAEFCGDANFRLGKFDQFASFDGARFHKKADFTAIRGERGFSMAEAEFDGVPDFIQAHFEEAPRLDNIRVHARMIDPPPEAPSPRPTLGTRIARRRTWPARAAKGVWRRITAADPAIPARFRALKRIAIQGHDADREHEFFGREIRHGRFADDWPWPWPFWKFEGWASFARFWWGLGYQVFGGLGTSLLLPFAWWLLTVVVAAALYLGENSEMIRERQALRYCEGASWYSAYVQSTATAAWSKPRACYVPSSSPRKDNDTNVQAPHVGALSADVRKGTDAPTEALLLSLRNAFIVLDGGGDAAHRTYGCLYGVELFRGSSPVTVVPKWVSTISAVQKLFSALFIFLFGLAVRNMLKMK